MLKLDFKTFFLDSLLDAVSLYCYIYINLAQGKMEQLTIMV